jgi:hypothetical protein
MCMCMLYIKFQCPMWFIWPIWHTHMAHLLHSDLSDPSDPLSTWPKRPAPPCWLDWLTRPTWPTWTTWPIWPTWNTWLTLPMTQLTFQPTQLSHLTHLANQKCQPTCAVKKTGKYNRVGSLQIDTDTKIFHLWGWNLIYNIMHIHIAPSEINLTILLQYIYKGNYRHRRPVKTFCGYCMYVTLSGLWDSPSDL